MDEVIIVGAGIGGLTLGLALHQARIPCRIFESVPEISAIGVGINLLAARDQGIGSTRARRRAGAGRDRDQ